MFREMRRFKQALPAEECVAILEKNSAGVLAVAGDDGYPYAVPVSYVYVDSKLYFHSALVGHKIDAITRNDKVSFCVIDQDRVVPEEYTTYFRSVIAFGRARILTDEKEKRQALEALAVKYSPGDDAQGRDSTINQSFDRVCIIEMSIEHMTGKEAKELAKARQAGEAGQAEHADQAG
ncbi:MAG TPA: pyridoxamine 5'-phosphate oxidase family protein [Spirochaetales bacterium]|nr:pyridoxamine 5'-phosphate oxidase family protein [Spirochaetales bacterium]